MTGRDIKGNQIQGRQIRLLASQIWRNLNSSHLSEACVGMT